MKNGCKYIAAFLLMLVGFRSADAQISIRAGIDHDSILIGEPILLSVEAQVPPGASVNWFPADSIPHFDVISRSAIDTTESMEGKKISQLLTITSFDSGRWVIPSFEMNVDGKNYSSDSLQVDIAFESFDPKEDYRDIRDIIEMSNPFTKYVPWVIAALALLSFAGLFVLLRRKNQRVVGQEPELSRRSIYEDAMDAIALLREKGLGEEGEKGYYSSMNDILRRYVAAKFSISTFERTNEELILKLSAMGIPKDAFIRLSQALRMSDFVKFAKYRPSEEDNVANLDIVRKSIEILNNHAVSAV